LHFFDFFNIIALTEIIDAMLLTDAPRAMIGNKLKLNATDAILLISPFTIIDNEMT